MSQISDFEKEYREQLAKAVAEEDMPPELLEEYDFENCILKTAKKEVYLLRRKTDGVQGLLRISISYPEEDALEEAKLLERLSSPAIPRVYATYKQGDRNYLLR